MTDQTPTPQNAQKARILLRIYITLVIIGGLLTLWSLLRIPAEGKNAALFGLSSERLVMVGGIVIVILGAGGMLLTSWLRKPFFEAFGQNLTAKLQQKNIWGGSTLISAMGLMFSSYLILLTPEITEPFTLAYFERLQPLLIWLALLCAQTLVALLLLRGGFNWHASKARNRIIYTIALIFGLLLSLWLLIALTGLGITASDAGAGWNYLGSPVMETQAFLAWAAGMTYIILALWGERRPDLLARVRKIKLLRADIVISILIWVAAFATWNSIPLAENWFVTPPSTPNEAFYPHSDARSYDTTGQSLLVGVGLKTHNAPFALRPVYTSFLAILHTIGGVDYEPIIWMQVAVLALIPVMLYWITRQLHNRVSAIIAAALIIFREANAIILGEAITTAHAKLLMSDLPTTLGVMIFLLLMIRWLQNPAQRQTLALVAGGVTGAFMLIRPEFGVLLPFIGFTALLQLIHQPKTWFKGMALLAVGTVIMLAPWVWRNYQITGTIFLDSPSYRANLFALRYQEPDSTPLPTSAAPTPETAHTTPTPKIAFLPGESETEFAERLAQDAAQFAQNNPGAVAAFIANHFLNSQVQTVLYLPNTWRLPDSALAFSGHRDPLRFWQECCSADGYIRRLPFWFKWDGTLPQQSIIFVLLNLFLISVGLASAWKQQRFIGLLPLAASLGYTLVNAAVRNSGGRYILAVDWVGMLYYAIGLGQLSLWGIAYFRGANLPSGVIAAPDTEIQTQPQAGSPPRWSAGSLKAASVILILGCLLPLSEKIVPARYSAKLLSTRYEILLQSPVLSPQNKNALADWQPSGGLIVQGRALYPQFHTADELKAGDPIAESMPTLSPRVDFYLVGPYNQGVVLPQEAAPARFPNGADVVVFGCNAGKYFDALAVAIYDEAGNLIELLRREPFPERHLCPLTEP